MSGFAMMMLAAGLFGTLAMLILGFSGPSVGKLQSRRLESVRERHSKSSEVATQAQLKRILDSRRNKSGDGFAQRFIPNPALLRLRLEQTGRNWTLSQYAMASAGLAVTVGLLLWYKGAPPMLALPLGLLAGAGLPHFIVGKLIKACLNQFTSR